MIDHTAVPKALRSQDIWVVWKWLPPDEKGRVLKSGPLQVTGKAAKSTDPKTWTSFKVVNAAAAADGFDGIGFCLPEDGKITGVDLDHVRDPETGAVVPEAQAVIDSFPGTYTEITPSEDGIRVIAHGVKRPGSGCAVEHAFGDGTKLEVYDRARYFTFTGNRIGDAVELAELQEAVETLCDNYLTATNGSSPGAADYVEPLILDDVDDQELVEWARRNKLWAALYDGEPCAIDNPSVQEFAFCLRLVRKTADDDQVDRIYRSSTLAREKWDKGRGGSTYGRDTIARARARLSQDEGDLWEAVRELRDKVDARPAAEIIVISEARGWDPLDLVQFKDQRPAAPSIGGILYPGLRTIISGEYEAYKTWFGLVLSKAEMDLGLPVLWIDLDCMGGAMMYDRLNMLGVDDKAISSQFIYYAPERKPTSQDIARMAGLVTEYGIRLAITDSFTPLLTHIGLSPNDNVDIEKCWQEYFDPLARAGAAAVVLDHVVKDKNSRGGHATGSERKASGARVHLGMDVGVKVTRTAPGHSTIKVWKDPGFHPRPTLGTFHLSPGEDSIAYWMEADASHSADGEWRPTDKMEEISLFLEGKENVSKKRIEDAVSGKHDTKRKALNALENDGYVTVELGAGNIHLVNQIRPFSVSDLTTPPPGDDLVPTAPGSPLDFCSSLLVPEVS